MSDGQRKPGKSGGKKKSKVRTERKEQGKTEG